MPKSLPAKLARRFVRVCCTPEAGKTLAKCLPLHMEHPSTALVVPTAKLKTLGHVAKNSTVAARQTMKQGSVLKMDIPDKIQTAIFWG